MSARWVETEEIITAWFREHGWPYAARNGRGKAGPDLINMPGLHPEIKARRDLDLPRWLRQASPAHQPVGPVGFVVHRPDGFGLASVEWWPVTFRLRDATTLLRDAGYGSGDAAEEED